MSSSTSSSEAAGRTEGAEANAARWARFVRAFAVTAATVLLGALALIWLIDPYGTGNTPLSLREGVRAQGPRTAAASRGRDPAFSGAIVGNSHVQLLAPERLQAATGIPFVSLIAPASGPKEGLVLIDWFLRNRREPARAVIVGIDALWCTADPAMPNAKPFPFWLYSRDPAEYLVGLMRFDVLEEAQRRLAYLVTGRGERARPDGYWDYEPNYIVQGYDRDPAKRAALEVVAESGGGNASGPYPAAAALEAMLAKTPGTALILVRPPAYHTLLPRPGSADAAADTGCRDAFAALAARRPLTALVDWRRDRPALRDPNQFFDRTHYRQPLARLVEADIAAALAGLR
ncbi:hypothetical protein [Bosea sp. (in: a-proteobacteria)]|uniref:hypothetical protein n=1 Tax=Bosea sp. (in: a-proteobacteria) TaxID=1871050 RepID=UPI002736A4F3|nr:hypothetical protein [Bosea sp. (in: a-proteobacteria)]MDP3410831.1 hypothetical protein [Bosea sp. (in: a-proteobacteria)]